MARRMKLDQGRHGVHVGRAGGERADQALAERADRGGAA